MFFLIIPYVTPKLFTIFSIWFLVIDISYTIYLLINSFLILGKYSVYLILFPSLIISLQLCCFCMELLFQLFYHCSYSFFLYVILPFKLLFFFSFLISPLWWCSKMFMYFVTFYRFFNPFFPPGFWFIFIFTSRSFKANLFSYIDYNCVYQDICISNIFSSDML